MIEDIVNKKWAFWAITGETIHYCNDNGDTLSRIGIGDLVDYIKNDMIAKRINCDKNGNLKH